MKLFGWGKFIALIVTGQWINNTWNQIGHLPDWPYFLFVDGFLPPAVLWSAWLGYKYFKSRKPNEASEKNKE